MFLELGNRQRIDEPTAEQIGDALRNLPADAPFVVLNADDEHFIQATPAGGLMRVEWRQESQQRVMLVPIEQAERSFLAFRKWDEPGLKSFPLAPAEPVERPVSLAAGRRARRGTGGDHRLAVAGVGGGIGLAGDAERAEQARFHFAHQGGADRSSQWAACERGFMKIADILASRHGVTIQSALAGGNGTCVGPGRRFVVTGTANTLLASSSRDSGEAIRAGRDLGSSGKATSHNSTRGGKLAIPSVLVPSAM